MGSLHSEAIGEGPGSTTVLVHGFTQTGRLWGGLAEALGAGRRVVLVDLPGHGGSAGVEAGLVEGAELLVQAVGAGPAPFDLVGYSLGARFALHAALAHPDLVRHLVLISGTAGIEDPGEREVRRRRDESMADALEASGDVAQFVTAWLASPMFVGLTPSASGREERLSNTAAGLASSLRRAGAGTQEPLWDRLAGLPTPVLVVAGANDVRFASIAARMARALPNGALALVPGAGHAVHLHQPELTARLVTHWLDLEPPRASR